MMKVIEIVGHQGLDSLRVGRRPPPPPPDPGEVLVRVRAASLNHVDLYMAAGGKGITHALPLVLGLDAAGEIVDAGTSGLAIGTKVVVYPGRYCGNCEFCRRGEQVLCLRFKVRGEHIDGTMAELMAVPATDVVVLPAEADLVQASCLPIGHLTAWRMLFTKACLRPGEDVLIFGIGGGVSLAALQLAKLGGARVAVTSRHPWKLERARALGADTVIDASRQDVAAAALAATGGRGMDVVIDNVGAATFQTGARCLRRGGRLVTCGATAGPDMGPLLQLVFIRQLTIMGSSIGSLDELAALAGLFGRGAVAPVVDGVHSMDDAPAAYRRMAAGEQFGKMVICP